MLGRLYPKPTAFKPEHERTHDNKCTLKLLLHYSSILKTEEHRKKMAGARSSSLPGVLHQTNVSNINRFPTALQFGEEVQQSWLGLRQWSRQFISAWSHHCAWFTRVPHIQNGHHHHHSTMVRFISRPCVLKTAPNEGINYLAKTNTTDTP